MFARTERLTLRPGWREDAPALAAAIGHAPVVRNLARAPWPYTVADAAAFLALPCPVAEPRFLIFAHEGPAVRLVGGIGIGMLDGERHELGYWITPDAWGRGYATEAGRAVVAIARALSLPSLGSSHFSDNPASGAVLRKLGFRPTGEVRPLQSLARGTAAPSERYALALGSGDDRLAA